MASISHIIDNIYLGNFESSISPDYLKKYNIGTIVRILDPGMSSSCKNNISSINYYPIELIDHPSENITKYFPKFLEFVNSNKKTNILIHCLMGISRSPIFTAMVLVSNYNFNVHNALDYIRQRRPIIKPKSEFIKQLVQYTS